MWYNKQNDNDRVMTMLWFLLVAAAIIGLVLAVSFYTFYVCFYSSKNRKDDPYLPIDGPQYEDARDNIIACTRIMDRAEFEWVSTRSHDGLRLRARYYHTKDDAPVLILFHGYRSAALRDCGGGYILGKKLGFNILAVDQRGHGGSDGRVISFGICERRDCLSWVEYVIARFGLETRIILSGLSMGASTVLMASALPLPANVVGTIADCPYSSPADIIRKVSRDRHLPDALAYPFIRLGARIYGCFDLEEITAAEAVKKASVPILLLHGEDDRFVPYEMSKEIFENCASPTRLHTFPDAGHGLCYMVDPLRYEAVTVDFLLSIPSLRTHLEKSTYVREQLTGRQDN